MTLDQLLYTSVHNVYVNDFPVNKLKYRLNKCRSHIVVEFNILSIYWRSLEVGSCKTFLTTNCQKPKSSQTYSRTMYISTDMTYETHHLFQTQSKLTVIRSVYNGATERKVLVHQFNNKHAPFDCQVNYGRQGQRELSKDSFNPGASSIQRPHPNTRSLNVLLRVDVDRDDVLKGLSA